MRLALAVSAWVLYTLAFAPAFSVVGDAAAMLAVLPVLVTAWLFGLRGGFGVALLNIPLTALLFNLAGQSGWEIMIRRWPGILAGFAVGVVTGWLSDLLRLVRQQSCELASEREALREQIAERQRAEEASRRARGELEGRVQERAAELAHANAEVAEAREQRLNEVTRAISSALELPTVLSTVVRLAAELVEAEAGTLALVASDGQAITFPYVFNFPNTLALQPVPRGKGLAWEILESGEPMLLADYKTHPQALPGWAAAGAHAFLGVPVAAGEARLGVLGLFCLNPARRFSKSDLALAESVGRQAAVAIHNAQLFEANRRRVAALTALHETSLALSAQLDLPALLRTITERAARLLGSPMGGFYLLLPDEQSLELVVSYNNDRDYTGYRLRLGEGLSGKVAQTGEPMIVDDYREWEGRAAIYEQAPFRAVLALPIKWQGKVLGVITTNDNRPNRFGLDDLELVGLFADQAAVAIVNARLFESLEHREEYFRALVENASEGITVLGGNGTIRYHSPFIERVLGYKPEDFMGQHALAPHLLHPDDLPIIDAFRNILQTPDVTETVEVRIRHKDGRWRHIEVTGHNLLDNPRVAGVVLNYRDITERKLAEEQLRKLSRAVEQSPASVVITDTNGSIEYVNPRFTEITGYTFEEVVGKNPRILKSGETPREVYKQLWDTITGGGEWRGEFHNKKKGGELYWELSFISPILDASGMISHFLGVKEDITERKQTEAALAAANAELERALLNARELAVAAQAANRAKSEFLANVSHEIRTPLTSVLGFTELTLNTDLSLEQRESLQQVHASGEILLELLNNILDLSRIEAARLDLEQVNFDLPSLLQQVMSALASRAAAKGLRFSHSLGPGAPASIVGDPTRLRQVLLNLLDNAIKYTERGEVTLEVWLERASAESALLHFAVRDTGIGIPKEKQGLIFEPFTQADGDISRKYGGAGLGLAISKKLVEKFSGELWVESKPEQGSAFHFFAVFGLPTR
jgi:PAS domain S-box-containing protein